MNDFLSLTIARTWDDQAIERRHQTHLRMLHGPWDPEVWFGTAPLDVLMSGLPESAEPILGEPGLYLRVEAPWHNDPPPAGDAGPTNRLWEHEVVELFIAQDRADGPTDEPDDGIVYNEFEMSPWGHYLFLRLEGVRNIVDSRQQVPYRARRSTQVWWGEAFLPMRLLPEGPHRINAFAMHGQGEARRYLASTPLPGEHPDFHQPEAFPRLKIPGSFSSDPANQ